MTTVYIIRHAQAEGNLYRRCHGWYNSLITPQGYRQIEALEARFRDIPIDAVYSSDLFRTMTTAKSVTVPKRLRLRLEPDLREVGMGIWEELTWGEALHADRESMAAFLRCDPHWQLEGSDTFPGAQDRFCAAIERIVGCHPDQTVACFAHGAVIRTAFARWMGIPLDRIHELPLGNNTSVSCLEFDGDRISIRFYADDSHLGTALSAPHRPSSGDGLTRMEETSVYFRPFHLPGHEEYYLSCRQEAWRSSHGTTEGFNGSAFLSDALRNFHTDPRSLLLAYIGQTPVGMLQLDANGDRCADTGRVPFLYVFPQYRSMGIGTQLLGQAIYHFRKCGLHRLKLRCAPENEAAKQFYHKMGLEKVGEEPGGIGHLDTMSLYIGTEL